MIKNRFLAAVMAVLAGVSVISCDELQEIIDTVIEVSISSDSDAFDANGQAVVKLNLNAASNKDINVIIGISAEAQSGFTAVSADALDFEGSVTIPAGTQQVPVTIKLNEKAQAGQQAVITIASASGATIGKDALVYLKVPATYSSDNGEGNGNGEENKPNLAGASVWAIIGAFNNWAGDVELTQTGPEEWKINGFKLSGEFKFRGNKEWGDYDLGSSDAIVLGQPLALTHKGANIRIDEGVYDIVLYPTELKAVFSAVETPPTDPSTLNWTLKYKGCAWLEGYYSEGQLENFEVSNTDVTKYYYPFVNDLADGDIEAEIKADPETFFANLQQDIEDTMSLYISFFGYTREELLPYFFYNESVDGTEVFQSGLPAGRYQFLVLSADSQGYFDQKYAILPFEKTEDAVSVYDWNINVSVNPAWNAEWDGWEPGEEGESFWVVGNAPGAAYVYVEAYTDEEIEEGFENGVSEMINILQSYVKDELYNGSSVEDAAENNDFIAVDADGSFETILYTYDVVGATNVYVIGLDAQGNIIGGYGKSPIEIPEYVEEPIEFKERTDWAVAYDANVDTGDTDYPYAVVTTACDAVYYVVEVYPEGYWEDEELDEICEDAMYYVDGYGLDACLEAGVAFDSVPGVYTVSKLKNGYEAYIFGLNEYGKPTGEWHMAVIDGVVEIPNADWKERTDWAINYDASVDTGDTDYPYAIVTTACDAPYFVTTIWDAGGLENDGLNDISDDALYYVTNYGMETCVKYDVVHTKVPSVDAWSGLENGLEAYIFAIDETGKLTGEWHMEVLTGIGETVAAPSVRKAAVVNAPKLSVAKKEIKGKALRANIKAASKGESFKASLKENKPVLPFKKAAR